MAYDVREVANFVLDFAESEGSTLSNLTINKVVFYVHAYFLVQFGRPFLQQVAWIERQRNPGSAVRPASDFVSLNPGYVRSGVINSVDDAELHTILFPLPQGG